MIRSQPWARAIVSSSSSTSRSSLSPRLIAKVLAPTSSSPTHPTSQKRREMSTSSPPASLASSTCVPCRSGGTPLTSSETASRLSSLHPEWHLAPFPLPQPPSEAPVQEASPSQVLQRHFAFRNFRHALAFADRIGSMAEGQKHHPALVVEWGRVSVGWWTHAIGGLHDNDFICAAKTDQLAEGAEGLKSKVKKGEGAQKGA